MKLAILVCIFGLFCFPVFGADTKKTVEIKVTEKGFEPSEVKVVPGEVVVLKVTRTTDNTCAREIQVPDRKIRKELPLGKAVLIDLGKIKKGEIRFGCGMEMMVAGKVYTN